MEKNTNFLFICKTEDEKYPIRVATQKDIDNYTKWAEDENKDIDFTVIGKINRQGLTVDLQASQIIWYTTEEKDKSLIDKAIMAIINYIF